VEKLDLESRGKEGPLRSSSWLLFLLVFSLALNLGSLGALAFRRWQVGGGVPRQISGPCLTIKELCRILPLEAAQCRQFQGMLPGHRQSRRRLLAELTGKRAELLALLEQDSPSWPEIQGKIKEISTRQGKLEEETVRLLWEWQQHLEPGQRKTLLSLLEGRQSGLPFKGQAFGIRKGQEGRHPEPRN